MYERKQIHYKSIFKQDGQSETIEYRAKGILHMGEKTQLSFDTRDGTININYGENEVVLNHGQSKLRFEYNQEVWNQYQLPYGAVSLKTKLLSFDANEERIKMKYELYDYSGLISTVYILIKILPIHIQEEA